MSNNTGTTLLALLTGAAIGAGIGILFAPDKGSNTRTKIKDGFDAKKDELKGKFDDLSVKMKDRFSKSKMDLESSFDQLVANVDEKAGDVIATLERKLQDLKSANSGSSSSNGTTIGGAPASTSTGANASSAAKS